MTLLILVFMALKLFIYLYYAFFINIKKTIFCLNKNKYMNDIIVN